MINARYLSFYRARTGSCLTVSYDEKIAIKHRKGFVTISCCDDMYLVFL